MIEEKALFILNMEEKNHWMRPLPPMPGIAKTAWRILLHLKRVKVGIKKTTQLIVKKVNSQLFTVLPAILELLFNRLATLYEFTFLEEMHIWNKSADTY